MRIFAQIEAGKVATKSLFEGEAPDGWVDVTDMAPQPEEGWGYSRKRFTAPDAPPTAKAELIAHLAAKRYEVEISGVAAKIGGADVVASTAREMRDGMRDTILRILTGSRKDGDALKIFADGVPRAATNDEAKAAIAAAGEHVQAAFNLEEALYPQIEAGTITSAEQIDAADWPVVAS